MPVGNAYVLAQSLLIGLVPTQQLEPALCMVEAVVYEARGEPLAGKEAIANVMLNRVQNHQRFPNDLCGVLNQPNAFSHRQQNETLHDLRIHNQMGYEALERAVAVTSQAMNGQLRDNTQGADHFFSRHIPQPHWATHSLSQVYIGDHEFVQLYP